jgi:hypothetical protein
VGLFAGGTSCYEAIVIAREGGLHLTSNLDEGEEVADRVRHPAERPGEHLMIDYGDDAMTDGRLHPIIDPTLRLQHLAGLPVGRTPTVVILDVVLGYGAHPDPAPDTAAAIKQAIGQAAADGASLAVVVSLTASAGDPQGREHTARLLRDAGASVHASNGAAVRVALDLIR